MQEGAPQSNQQEPRYSTYADMENNDTGTDSNHPLLDTDFDGMDIDALGIQREKDKIPHGGIRGESDLGTPEIGPEG